MEVTKEDIPLKKRAFLGDCCYASIKFVPYIIEKVYEGETIVSNLLSGISLNYSTEEFKRTFTPVDPMDVEIILFQSFIGRVREELSNEYEGRAFKLINSEGKTIFNISLQNLTKKFPKEAKGIAYLLDKIAEANKQTNGGNDCLNLEI